MKEWYEEDWRFRIDVIRVGKENRPEECRLGLEPGDTFECTYGTPGGFCPTAFLKLFPVLEVMRCGGDLRYLGTSEPYRTEFLCPDGVVTFRVSGEQTTPG